MELGFDGWKMETGLVLCCAASIFADRSLREALGSKPTWKTFDRGPSIKLLEASTGLGFDGGWEMKIERWVLRFQGNGFDGMSLNNLKEWVRWEWFWWIFVLMLWWAEMVCWKWKVRMAGSIGSNGLLVWSMNCMLESSD